ncbi:4-azaleucine resistance transporter AzlC [Thermocatellispora tengchongensis]|uniref:4-azaleucine resistance transporter AzlC n=1 Tax=Thermocatellispora tengchongensis TaxID=1073253 RepID=A0A840P1P7_9ACTN|nr:AzlC family ABC transporter permease [Thermocatellispora tengchongensis]MBB5131853.1 4-azaleucine resistance transporter AzlC [Thermocatellispora tengchongensis]
MIRSIQRTLGADLARDIALVCLANALVGLSYGAITVASGFAVWVPMLLSVVVFAGAAQFLFVGLVASGGNPVAAVVAALLVNARHLPFGFAVGDVLGRGWGSRIAGSHLMVDESVAFALAQQDPARRRAAYWACGIGLFGFWNIGVVAGAYAGTVITDTGAFGLDAAFPAVLLALVLPALKERGVRRAALAGAALALAATPFLPAGLPVLLALLGLLAVARGRESEVAR